MPLNCRFKPVNAGVFMLFFTLFVIFHNVSALPDNLYIAMEPNSIKCFNIVLPDDMGVIVPGKVEYTITVNPSSDKTWASLSEMIVRTDENNVVVVPLCFSTYGKWIGQCSERFKLTISAEGLPNRTFEGGVCVYNLTDVDTENIGYNETTREALSHVDLFDMKVKKAIKFSTPNVPVNYTVMLESYASVLTVDLAVKSDGRVITSKEVSFSDKEYKEINFTLKARKTGTYNFSIVAKIKDCKDGDFCVKKRDGKLIVKKTLQGEVGFTVSIFPQNINIKQLRPVRYQVTITNNAFESDNFAVDVKTSGNLTTDFKKQTLNIPQGKEKTIEFYVTPESVSSLFNITVVVSSAGVVKENTAYLSTNEMLTDTLRNAELNKNATADLNRWYSSYTSSDYGSNLNEYAKLNKEIAPDNNENNDVSPNDSETKNEGESNWISYLYWGVPVTIIIVILFVILMKFRSEPSEIVEEEFEY